MKITGLDRVAIMVRSMEKAKEFFSGKLGIELRELDQAVAEASGAKVCVSLDHHLELIEPIFPINDNLPGDVKRCVGLLKDQESVIMALVFKVEDIDKIAAEAESAGVRITRKIESVGDYVSIGLGNLKELVAKEEDTLGLVTVFAAYDRTC